MLLKELLSGIEFLACRADPEIEISGISYDSRKTRKGDLFVAISGFETDGHRFIPAALQNGASVIVCEREPETDCPYILVSNCRASLSLLSIRFFDSPAEKMKMIGLTGTNGKTTSSYLIKHILEVCTGEKVGLIGTISNRIGDRVIPTERTTPESYELQKLLAEMVEAGCRYVVMEVSSHSLKLDRVYGIRFDTAVFTNLTQDHLDFHLTMEDYAASKKKLFYSCRKACINDDDAWSTYFKTGVPCEVQTYSASDSEADFSASDIVSTDKGVTFSATYRGETKTVHVPSPGDFSVHNALCAVSVACSLGISFADAVAAANTSTGVKGRMEVVPSDRDYTILIDYAHTPDALQNVLRTLKPLTKGRLITVFGCGGDRDRTKRPIMGAAARTYSDFCVVTSDNPRTEDPDAIIADILPAFDPSVDDHVVIRDRIEAIHWAIDNACGGDVILLAGKGHEDYQVIGREKHHFDEREIVLSYLKGNRS